MKGLNRIQKLKFLFSMAAIATSLFGFNSSAAIAAGISLGATRVVYPANDKQAKLTVNNTTNKQNYLIQTWIEDSNGKKTTDFIVTPPLFISKGGRENTLNIIYTGGQKSDKKEVIYYLNSKAIPSVEKPGNNEKNTLSLAILTRIKLFYRPRGLKVKPDESVKMLSASVERNVIKFDNKSPYYLSLVDVIVGKTKVGNIMVPPLSTIEKTVNEKLEGEISYSYINDYGAIISDKLK